MFFLLNGGGQSFMKTVVCGETHWSQSMRGSLGLASDNVINKASMWWRDLAKVCVGHSEDKWFKKMCRVETCLFGMMVGEGKRH